MKDLQFQISQGKEKLGQIFYQYEGFLQYKEKLRCQLAQKALFSNKGLIENPYRIEKSPNEQKIKKIGQTKVFIEKIFQFFIQVFQKYEKSEALNKHQEKQIEQLEQYIKELSEEFSVSKDKLNQALERLTITNQILQQSEVAYQAKLGSSLERNRNLTQQIDFITRNIEKLHQSSRKQRNETQEIILENEFLKKKIERLENMLNGKAFLVENPEKQIACSKVIERINYSDLKEKARHQCEKYEVDYDKLTKENETNKSSPIRQNKSILLNNSIAHKIVYSRTRPRSVYQTVRKFSESQYGEQKKQNSPKFGFLSYVAESLKGNTKCQKNLHKS